MSWALARYAGRASIRTLFGKRQREIDGDRSNFRVILGGRRAGKTLLLVGSLIEDAMPGCVYPYIGPTAGDMRNLVWGMIEEYAPRFGWVIRLDRQRNVIHLENGATIPLCGMSTRPEVEKLRGPKYPTVVIDECGACLRQDLLQRLVTEVIRPATLDFMGRGGRGIVLGGTPSYAPVGYWWEACMGNHGGVVHRTTLHDNPLYEGRADAVLEQVRLENKLLETDAVYRREYLGEFSLDTAGLCYSDWEGTVAPAAEIPPQGMTVMGLDFGDTSPCAWVVIRVVPVARDIGDVREHGYHVHFVAACEQVCSTLHEVAAKTRELQKAWHVGWISGDSAEGMAINTLRDQHGIPIERSAKSGLKRERIWNLQSMFRARTCTIHEGCNPLVTEVRGVPWDEGHGDHHPRFADHALDAAHYAIELAMQHVYQRPAEPVPGTESALRAQAERAKRRALTRIR